MPSEYLLGFSSPLRLRGDIGFHKEKNLKHVGDIRVGVGKVGGRSVDGRRVGGWKVGGRDKQSRIEKEKYDNT